MKAELIDIQKPKGLKRLSNTDALLGPVVDPLNRLRIIDEDSYEDIIAEWAVGYLPNKYYTIKQFGGSGDKGRDICALQMTLFLCLICSSASTMITK